MVEKLIEVVLGDGQLLVQLADRLRRIETAGLQGFAEKARMLIPKPAIIPFQPSLTPPGAETLKILLKQLGLTPRALMRKKESAEVGLDDPKLSDAQLIAGMVKHPIVIERPIVVNGAKAALGRPPEAVLKIL